MLKVPNEKAGMRDARISSSIQSIADRQVGGEARHTFTVTTTADIIENPFLSITLPPAPDGNYYRALWPLLFIKKVVVTVGTTVIQEMTREMLLVQYLSQKQEEWVAETVWDLPAGDRFLRSCESAEGHATFFTDFLLPLMRLAGTDVRFIIYTHKLNELLEMPNPNFLGFVEMRLKAQITRYGDGTDNTDRRRELYARVQQHQIIQNTYYTTDLSCLAGDITDLSLANKHNNSCFYIHLRDENDVGITGDLIRQIDVAINGVMVHSVSGFEARTRQRELLPYDTKNMDTKNMYYVALSGGDGAGVNLAEATNYLVRIHWLRTFPMCRLLLSHRINNTVFYERGGLRLENPYAGEMKLQVATQKRPNIPIHLRTAIKFQQGDVCSISLEELHEGQDADCCPSCKKLFDSEGLEKWLGTGVQSCPNCRSDLLKKGVWRGPLSLTEEGVALISEAKSSWSKRLLWF